MNNPKVLIVQRLVPHYRVALFKALSRSNKLTVRVAYGKEPMGNSLHSEMDVSGITSVRLQNLFWGKNKRFVYQRGLLSLLHPKRIDVVIAEFDVRILSNILACFKAHLKHIGFIWWGHGIGPRAAWLSKAIRLFLIRYAGAIVFYDEERAERFISWGVPKEKVFVARNSVDTEEIKRFVSPWGATERHRILYIGRLVPQKKVDLLIEGYAQAYPFLNHDVRLTIIGDGSEREVLGLLAARLGIASRVEFVGAVFEQNLLAPYFNTSLISVSPGAIGLSAIHSLAYGVPVLVADKERHGPEFSMLEAGRNADFFSSDNSAALAEKLIAVTVDKDRLRAMGLASLELISGRYGIDAMQQAFEAAVLGSQGRWLRQEY